MGWRSLGLAAALLVGGCSPSASTNTQVIDNAVDDEQAVTGAADDRADRLDEAAADLLSQANGAVGQTRSDLRNAAAADVAEAQQIRNQGQAAGEQVEDNVEQKAGLLNQAQ